ncbi:haloacid dehalogenase type II [Telmatospirillum sp.]|uniref:haloacid dehalogenase type II n=1 Tax=Telmatospirillum sp. TaxID=2079197 RepID=UPI00284094BE|nr:haloacid dehalogenase type II [Telmatospirillum sp.]MDR3438304.1 haloacid dehalogenase type II [Telmatospirillum sp.]
MPAPMSGISVCVFDAYGTLFDLKAVVETGRRVLGDRADELSGLWRRKQLEYSWLRSLMGRHSDFWHVTGESLDYALKAMSIDDPSLRSRLMEAYLSPATYPEVKATIEKLKTTGHRLAILSNGSPTMLTSATKAAGLAEHFDAVLSVETVGIYKPHPTVYRLVTDHFDCQAANVAFLSSNGWDAAGASAFGFQVVWVNRDGLPRDILPAVPHAEVTSLASLPDLLS